MTVDQGSFKSQEFTIMSSLRLSLIAVLFSNCVITAKEKKRLKQTRDELKLSV